MSQRIGVLDPWLAPIWGDYSLETDVTQCWATGALGPCVLGESGWAYGPGRIWEHGEDTKIGVK